VIVKKKRQPPQKASAGRISFRPCGTTQGLDFLELEHRKKRLESADESSKEDLKQLIRVCQAWLDAQRWNFLVEINVGAWSGRTTREMADEAGILDFYNYVYTPFSQCAHSTWYHVGRYNSGPSESPLTRQLWMPRVVDSPSDVWNLSLAAKYLDKSFNAFDEKALGRRPSSGIQDWISKEIEARLRSEGDKQDANGQDRSQSGPNQTTGPQ
jgi:hypothetical protein